MKKGELIIIVSTTIDLTEKERRIDEAYALDNPEGVRLLLSDYHALVKRQYDGDTDAIVIIADLSNAIELANLTSRQKSAINCVFIKDWTQGQTGRELGISQQAVGNYIATTLSKIAAVFEYWAKHDEGYRLSYGKGNLGND
ncbi:MAG TPA: RNA polymerase subunit sigma [Ornithinibacillus sp.]|nr:RNA polymerase subunit sigma [Ornithinibacillus sp.]